MTLNDIEDQSTILKISRSSI